MFSELDYPDFNSELIDDLNQEYLNDPSNLPLYDFRRFVELPDFKVDYRDLFSVEPSKPTHRLEVVRDKLTGAISDFTECEIDAKQYTADSTASMEDMLYGEREWSIHPSPGVSGRSPCVPSDMRHDVTKYHVTTTDSSCVSHVTTTNSSSVSHVTSNSHVIDCELSSILDHPPLVPDFSEHLDCSKTAESKSNRDLHSMCDSYTRNDLLRLVEEYINIPGIMSNVTNEQAQSCDDNIADRQQDTALSTTTHIVPPSQITPTTCQSDISHQTAYLFSDLNELFGFKFPEVKFSDKTCLNDLPFDLKMKSCAVPAASISTHVSNTLYISKWTRELDMSVPFHDFHIKVPVMAKSFPYELDTFQKYAIYHIEQGHSIFVAAHTSAGKTTVAEYAIALALRHGTRVIYTSPVKALSNQKFRDLSQLFGKENIGLLTGDIQINSSCASCLICTTEILRSMLYNGSDVVRDLEWVVFDEVHYVNDKERGHVWEESLIMLPESVGIILLSATVPNACQFSDWVGCIKKRHIYVVSTKKRPVPLKHFLYTEQHDSVSENLHLIMNESNEMQLNNYNKLIASLNNEKIAMNVKNISKQAPDVKQGGNKFNERKDRNMIVGKTKHDISSGKHGRSLQSTSRNAQNSYVARHGGEGRVGSFAQQEKNYCLGLTKCLQKHDLLPAVLFVLSRTKCDTYLRYTCSLNQLTTPQEKSRIRNLCDRCLSSLSESDRKLPQVVSIKTSLERGIGVHHSGILPVLKEIIEILFHQGLVKLLFATETFAVGINMPTRTVVFESLMKYDGTDKRYLKTSEYIQMAGRAGRRGRDSVGTVIICFKSCIGFSELKSVLQGKAERLESKFQLTYGMILNMINVPSLKTQDFLRRSFAEVAFLKKFEESKFQKILVKKKINDFIFYDWSIQNVLTELFEKQDLFFTKWNELFENYFTQNNMEGRIISFNYENKLLLGVIYSNKRKCFWRVMALAPTYISEQLIKSSCAFDQLIHIVSDTDFYPIPTSPILRCFVVEQIAIKNIYCSVADSKLSLKSVYNELQLLERCDESLFSPNSFCSDNSRLIEILQSFLAKHQSGDNDYKLDDENYTQCCLLRDQLKSVYHSFSQQCDDLRAAYDNYSEYWSMQKLLDGFDDSESDEKMNLYCDYLLRLKVLRQVDMIDSNDVVTMKGRVCRSIGYKEMLVTQLLLEYVYSDCTAPEFAAIMSAIVFEQKSPPKKEPNLTSRLVEKKNRMLEIADSIDAIHFANQITNDEPFKEMLRFGLVQVVYEWAGGREFNDIISLTDVQEGIIVRCIQRLDELIRDISSAAYMVGLSDLAAICVEASELIRRDIVFLPSLYIKNDDNI